jgi:hypothetical protein
MVAKKPAKAVKKAAKSAVAKVAEALTDRSAGQRTRAGRRADHAA